MLTCPMDLARLNRRRRCSAPRLSAACRSRSWPAWERDYAGLSTGGIVTCLSGLAEAAEAKGRLERAARLLGHTQALLEAAGASLNDVDQAEYDSDVAAARAKPDEAAFAVAWAEGSEMAAGAGEQAVAYALGDTPM